MKRCTNCLKEKDITEFHKRNDQKSLGLMAQCKVCMNAKRRVYRHNNIEATRKSRREYNRKHAAILGEKQGVRRFKLKFEVFKLLGSVCKICGFKDSRALQIDHIDGDGSKDRSKFKGNWERYLKAIIEMPSDEMLQCYQLLCANCNVIKRIENSEYGNGKTNRWKPEYYS